MLGERGEKLVELFSQLNYKMSKIVEVYKVKELLMSAKRREKPPRNISYDETNGLCDKLHIFHLLIALPPSKSPHF